MQRYGPPPSYPNLKIPGLNAPIPADATYGYHPGGWEKIPVNEYGEPLYGDAFGQSERVDGIAFEKFDQTLWSEFKYLYAEDDDEQYGEDDEDNDDQMDDEEDRIDESGFSSVDGMETPSGEFDLRKKTTSTSQQQQEKDHRPLFQVIEQQVDNTATGLIATNFRYVLPSSSAPSSSGSAVERVEMLTRGKAQKTEVAFDPSEIEAHEGLTDELIIKKYHEKTQQNKDAGTFSHQDNSDLVAEQAAKMKKKAKKQQKSFKF